MTALELLVAALAMGTIVGATLRMLATALHGR